MDFMTKHHPHDYLPAAGHDALLPSYDLLTRLMGMPKVYDTLIAQAELADWYRAATVVLTPSHSESFGLVALEAQACGTPVVAASVGGLRTVVRDDYSGVLVHSHDPADWAQAIRRLLRAPGRLHALSAGAIRHASTFGWSATVDQLATVYTGAMDETAARVRA